MAAAYSDKYLLSRTLELSKKFNTTTFIETGAFHGETAEIVSKYFDVVYTIEIDANNYEISNTRLSNIPNCVMHFGDSVQILDNILNTIDGNIFLFLDAHWYKMPLRDELKIVSNKKIKPVIAIHDFFVPNEDGTSKFKYTMHDENNVLVDFNYIKNWIDDICMESMDMIMSIVHSLIS